MIRSLVRILHKTVICILLMIVCSHIFYPRLSKDICIVDSRMNAHLESIDKVIAAFNRNGIPMHRSCADDTSIQLKYGTVDFPSTDGEVLAFTFAYGASLTYHNKDKLGVEKETYQVFVPLISPVYEREITFNIKEKDLSEEAFQLILTHEIGHALGAPHIYTDRTHIMNPYISKGQDLDQSVQQIKDLTDYLQRY